MSDIPTPIIGLIIAVFVLVFLVIRTRVHALIAMLAAACIAGITGGMSIDKTLTVITQGFGSTLGSIGIVIGLGVMMGRLLEVSGAAEQIAYSFIKWLGKRREEWALAITGYIVSIPIFVDSAFVILYPVAKALAKSGKRSLLTLGVALAGGLVVTHHTVPPTPGPLGVAGLFGVDIGAMLLTGMALAIPCVLGIVFYAQWLDKKYPEFGAQAAQTPDELQATYEQYLKEKEGKTLPSLTLSLLPILVPIVLIFVKAIFTTLATLEGMDGLMANPLVQGINFIGTPIIALAISVLLAVYTLVPHMDRHATAARLEEGLQSAGIILLVTGAGGALGAVLRDSGAGQQLAEQIAQLPISPILIPFIVATLVRLIQGSGTVAMVTAASISAPILAQIPGVNMLLAAGAGGAEGVDAQFGRVDVDRFHFVGFRHHRHGAGRGVDAALRFGGGHALHAVAAGFEFQLGIRAKAHQSGDDFLIAAQVGFAGGDDFHLPAIAFGKARVHAEQISSKQCRLIAAGAGADFQKNIAFVVGVARQQEFLQRQFQLAQADFAVFQLGLRQFAHVRVGQQLFGGAHIGLALAKCLVLLDHRGQFGVFAGELAKRLHVAGGFFGGQQARHFIEPVNQLIQFAGNRGFHRRVFFPWPARVRAETDGQRRPGCASRQTGNFNTFRRAWFDFVRGGRVASPAASCTAAPARRSARPWPGRGGCSALAAAGAAACW